jgi:hypothetical protein
VAERTQPALRLFELAPVLGCYRWIEQRLFELTGAWASEVPVPEAQLHLHDVSRQHAWHADLWAERLPVLDGMDPWVLTRPLGPAVGPLFAALAGAESPNPSAPQPPPGSDGRGVVQRLAGLYRVVLPRLLTTYQLHLARTVRVTDGPVIRALRLVQRDELEACAEGERLLQRVLARPHDAQVAAAVHQRLESIVLSGDIGPGLVPWPTESGR